MSESTPAVQLTGVVMRFGDLTAAALSWLPATPWLGAAIRS